MYVIVRQISKLHNKACVDYVKQRNRTVPASRGISVELTIWIQVNIWRYCDGKTTPSKTKKRYGFRPPNCSEQCLYIDCNVTCLLLNMINVILYNHRWISMLVADGLMPIWHQAICNHHCGAGRSVHTRSVPIWNAVFSLDCGSDLYVPVTNLRQ